jgi:hypothetical protein
MSGKQKLGVEDRLDLQELFARYCWALNTGVEDDFLDCFLVDGWLQHQIQPRAIGHDAIRAVVRKLWYGKPYDYVGRQHQQSGFVMAPEGPGARVKAYWTVNQWHTVTEKIGVTILGDWNAYCEKRDGEWKFKELLVTHWGRQSIPWKGDPSARFMPE